MIDQIVVLSGQVGCGKTTLARRLAEEFPITHAKTREFLMSRGAHVAKERGALQKFGEELDHKTKGEWVREDLDKLLRTVEGRPVTIVDAARIQEQVEAIRRAYGRRVIHIHLMAPKKELEKRYKRRKTSEIKELSSYDDVLQNKTEREIESLAEIADVVIDSDQCTEADVFVRAASHIGMYGGEYLRLVDVVVGGQFGSEGKGQVVEYLSREYDLLVRVGGPNAGHTVYEEPEPYTFHHLPSGARKADAQLLIGPGATLYVPTLLEEIAACGIGTDRLRIDPQAMIISEEDRDQEERGLREFIGSTAQGVGYATARRIVGRGDASKKVELARDNNDLRPFTQRTALEVLEDAFRGGTKILLEGTQGMGLSLYHGFYPHVTSRDTTIAGCLAEAGISPSRVRKVVMVCRTYPIRVESPKPKEKTSGPMSQETTWKEIARRSGLDYNKLIKAERTSTTGRSRRVGEFDWVLLRKAASLNAPTDVALTFTDHLNSENRNARRFEQLAEETIRFIEEVERVAAAPVSLISTRFHSRSIIDRRVW